LRCCFEKETGIQSEIPMRRIIGEADDRSYSSLQERSVRRAVALARGHRPAGQRWDADTCPFYVPFRLLQGIIPSKDENPIRIFYRALSG